MEHFTTFFLKLKSNLLVKRVFFVLNAAFAMAILVLISRLHFASFVNQAIQIVEIFKILQLLLIYHNQYPCKIYKLINEYKVSHWRILLSQIFAGV